MAKSEKPWHVTGHEDYLDRLINGNAETILTICADDRERDAKLSAVKGLIQLALVRALQAERGEFAIANEQLASPKEK